MGRPLIRDIIKKVVLEKKELTTQEKEDLLLYFELDEPDGSVKVYPQDLANKSGEYILEDLTSQVLGTNNYFQLSQVAKKKCDVSCNLQQLPSSIAMYANMKGFYLSFVPTVKDKVVAGYFI